MARRSSNSADEETAELAEANVETLPLEQFMTYRLNVLSNMLNRQMERFLKPQFDISLPDWRVLAHLGRFQAMSVRELSAYSQMDKALVSRAVARLVKKGLVSSKPDPNDGRLVVLALTKSGQKMFKTIMPLVRQRQQRLYACIDHKSQAAFDQALDALIATAREYDRRKSDVNELW